ncbi:MAG: dTDP-4-dehydrorhamnose 3,5-epimerase [Candidatus Moranbacteria bacterium]|nr:dTDP-4-dehydrorhamnose 3,5-epimerase [Candidatus Moranbacteria bacterium]
MLEFQKTKIEGVFLIKPKVNGDHRGFFLETYREEEFLAAGIDVKFVQDNHSFSAEKGVLRGLHFQWPPFAQAKLVRVVKGKLLDVVVDLRKDSPTFGQWESFELSEENFQMLFVPRGMAHGFCVLETDTHFLYKTDNYYNAESDAGIAWNDPELKITWPIASPILSEKDQKQQSWQEFLKNNPF